MLFYNTSDRNLGLCDVFLFLAIISFTGILLSAFITIIVFFNVYVL